MFGKACNRPFDLHELSHNTHTHTPKALKSIDADREGSVVRRRVIERVKGRDRQRDKRERVKGIEHAVD